MSYIKKIIRRWQESKWKLGICLHGFDDLKRGNIQWIDNGKYDDNKWFADPFILDYDDYFVYLLVEEFDYKVHRGRIAKLTVDRRKWEVVECKIILDLDTHLSFPMIWREGSEIFVCPENYQSGGWNMYRYDESQEKLEYVKRIIDEKLTDAIIWKNEDCYWLLSTCMPKPNDSELKIWKKDRKKESYIESQSVRFNENIARNAGMIFSYNGRLIRPAQECNHSYGHSISFQEMVIKEEKFCFNEIFRFLSPHHKYNTGCHTYNQYGEMAVIDVKKYRYGWFVNFIVQIHRLLTRARLKR